MDLINHYMEVLKQVEMSQVLATVAIAVEFGLRMVKSEKPLSIMYLVADGFKKCGALMVKVGEILDKVLPQRLK